MNADNPIVARLCFIENGKRLKKVQTSALNPPNIIANASPVLVPFYCFLLNFGKKKSMFN